MSLSRKSCIPCQGGIPPLTSEDTRKLLSELGQGWEVNPDGHLTKSYTHKDFMSAMTQANRIADIAEAENHHPDLAIKWGSCTVEIWTHKINGLTESDFILAAKIEDAV